MELKNIFVLRKVCRDTKDKVPTVGIRVLFNNYVGCLVSWWIAVLNLTSDAPRPHRLWLRGMHCAISCFTISLYIHLHSEQARAWYLFHMLLHLICLDKFPYISLFCDFILFVSVYNIHIMFYFILIVCTLFFLFHIKFLV